MRSAVWFLPLFLLFSFSSYRADAQPPAKPLSINEIFARGGLTGETPRDFSWSPDGRRFTYLLHGELMAVDPATGKTETLVSHDQLASLAGGKSSEIDRDHRDRYKMGGYFWAPDSQHLLFDINGQLWLYNFTRGAGVKVAASGEASGDNPQFSPDGKHLSFLRNHGLAVVDLSSPHRPIAQAVRPAKGAVFDGEIDWLYLEELGVRSNYFWSPDSQRLAFLESDESAVPTYPIADWIPTHTQVEEQRYPQAGDPNPAVRVGVVSAHGGRPLWMKLPLASGQDYIPRFGWASARTLWIETLRRDHKRQAIYVADAQSGQCRLALEIRDQKFVDENYDATVYGGAIVLSQWSDGHNHLYLYRYNPAAPGLAKPDRQLTRGDFDVAEIKRIDFEKQTVDYAANEGDPLSLRLWRVSFQGQRQLLAAAPGRHEGTFAPSGTAFADLHSTRLTPPELKLCPETDNCRTLWRSRSLEAYALHKPELLTFRAADGTPIAATLLLPEGAAPARLPLIVNPYGGPGEMQTADRWKYTQLFDEVLVQHGFAVLHAENRGGSMRGRAFAQAAYRNFGPVQLEDQLAAVDAALARYPQLDPKRLGWWGWSWGGSFTLYAMTHSDRFRAGVAVAPVTDWRNYDSVYTERYLGLPKDFPEDYRNFSAVNSAANLKGRLLLVHGASDDNVHLANSVQFVQKLIEADIPYDLQLYPRKTHSIAGAEARTHLFQRILAHFETYLKPQPEQ